MYSPISLTASKPPQNVQHYNQSKDEAKSITTMPTATTITEAKPLVSPYQPPHLINAPLRSTYNSPLVGQKQTVKASAKNGPYLPAKSDRSSQKTKKTLLLDLDETLVHSVFYPIKETCITLSVFLMIALTCKYSSMIFVERLIFMY